jgi:hypothetical protein
MISCNPLLVHVSSLWSLAINLLRLILFVWLKPNKQKIFKRRFNQMRKLKMFTGGNGNKKKRTVYSPLNMVLLAIIIVLGFALFKSLNINRLLRGSLPYLTPGETIEYFHLSGMDARTIDDSVLKQDKPSLVFIFSRPCSPCNKNIVYWKKMAEILKDKVTIYGVILGNVTDAYNFSENTKLNFNIYVPENIDAFIQKLRIKMNLPQTIVFHKTVRLVKLGTMEGEDAVSIIKFVNDLI